MKRFDTTISKNNIHLIWADSLKGWLILLVILGHAIQRVMGEACFNNYWWNLIYSFHMSAFMVISGFVSYKPKIRFKQSINNRFQQLIIPFLLWTIISNMYPPHLLNNINKIILHPDISFWFLWVLFFISLIFASADWVATFLRKKQEVVVAFVATVLILIMVFLEFRLFGFQFIAYYFMFYCVGFYMRKYEDRTRIVNKVILIVLSALWLLTASFWKMHELPFFLRNVPIIPASLLQYSYRFFVAFVAVIVLMNLGPLYLNKKGFVTNWIMKIGQVSLGLYVVHLTIIGHLVKLLQTLFAKSSDGVLIFISFIVAFLLSYAIVTILANYRLTSRFLLGKNKIT